MVTKIGAKDFKRRVKAKLQAVNPNIKEEDLYFTQTATGYYLEYNTNYPEKGGNDYFIVSQDLIGCITVTGNVNALIPAIRYFEDMDDFENNL